MTTPDLMIIVPTRGRPHSAARVVQAWIETGAFDDGAGLAFVVDESDPLRGDYYATVAPLAGDHYVQPILSSGPWRPMVHKLDSAAEMYAQSPGGPFAIGFAGDDHVPRTPGWAWRYLAELRAMRTGIVYGADGMRRGQEWPLPTQWAMTADIVRVLGRMVPPAVEHLYCDNAIRDLGRAADCLAHLPDVMIEHMHPLAGKAQLDEGYLRVNSTMQYVTDKEAYQRWRDEQFDRDVKAVVGLMRG